MDSQSLQGMSSGNLSYASSAAGSISSMSLLRRQAPKTNNSKEVPFDQVLLDVHIVDVVGGCLQEHRSILIRQGKIHKIYPSVERLKADIQYLLGTKHCRTWDLKGEAYVMPGLIDCHVHVTAFTASFALLEQTSESYVTARALQTCREMLYRGFTTIRDAGGADHGLARALSEGISRGPRLLFCGKALSQTGGHGDMRLPGEFAKTLSQCCGLGRICDGDTEVRRAVRDEVRKGATHIKVMAGGGVSSPTDRITSTQFSTAELKAIVEEAAAANIPVMAHAYTPRSIVRAVAAGVTSIEHGNLLDAASAQAMAEAGTYLVPTLLTYDLLKRQGLQQGLSQDMVDKVDDVLEAGMRSIQIAYKYGIRMAFGTDCLAAMRDYQLHEFALLEEAGLPMDEILRTATCHAAELVNMKDEIGVVAQGARADLLVLSENPLLGSAVFEDWDAHCLAVMKDGVIQFEPQGGLAKRRSKSKTRSSQLPPTSPVKTISVNASASTTPDKSRISPTKRRSSKKGK